jgi:hypothetical protein
MVPKPYLKRPRSMKTIQSQREARRLSKRAVLVVLTPKAQHPNNLPALPKTNPLPRQTRSDRASHKSMW